MIDLTSLPVEPASLEDLEGLVGQTIGPTEWHHVTQDVVNRFADATGDQQWIHVDTERAAASPLGSTIAHGLYSLSLGPVFTYSLLSFDAFTHALNYGYDKVRFPAPLPVGSRIRMRMKVVGVERATGGAQVRLEQVYEREGSSKPIAVAESLSRVMFDQL